jgi:hypothetical protein
MTRTTTTPVMTFDVTEEAFQMLASEGGWDRAFAALNKAKAVAAEYAADAVKPLSVSFLLDEGHGFPVQFYEVDLAALTVKLLVVEA